MLPDNHLILKPPSPATPRRRPPRPRPHQRSPSHPAPPPPAPAGQTRIYSFLPAATTDRYTPARPIRRAPTATPGLALSRAARRIAASLPRSARRARVQRPPGPPELADPAPAWPAPRPPSRRPVASPTKPLLASRARTTTRGSPVGSARSSVASAPWSLMVTRRSAVPLLCLRIAKRVICRSTWPAPAKCDQLPFQSPRRSVVMATTSCVRRAIKRIHGEGDVAHFRTGVVGLHERLDPCTIMVARPPSTALDLGLRRRLSCRSLA